MNKVQKIASRHNNIEMSGTMDMWNSMGLCNLAWPFWFSMWECTIPWQLGKFSMNCVKFMESEVLSWISWPWVHSSYKVCYQEVFGSLFPRQLSRSSLFYSFICVLFSLLSTLAPWNSAHLRNNFLKIKTPSKAS